MPLRLGCDIVQISRFADSVRREGDALLSRIFLPRESDGASIERLAGLFAAKEAACKAFGIAAGNWHAITLTHEPSGAPRLSLDAAHGDATDASVSISHDGDYAMAVVIAPSAV